MKKADLYEPRFVGKRFDDHMVPLSLLEDFAHIEDLTKELAKHLYLEENSDKKKIPKGFTKDVELKLESLSEGSAILKVLLISIGLTTFSDANAKYYKEASEKIVNAISAAENNKNITNYIPGHLLHYFEKLGKNLGKGESIEFSHRRDNKSVLNITSRKRLADAYNKTPYNKSMSLRGKVAGYNKATYTFFFERLNGKIIQGTYHASQKRFIEKAVSQYDKEQYYVIRGVCYFDKADNLIQMNSIDQHEDLGSNDITVKIEKFLNFKRGWYNGDGIKFDKSFIYEFANLYDDNFDHKLLAPKVFPIADGGISMEWDVNDIDISLTIPNLTDPSELHSLDFLLDTEHEESFDLTTESGWRKLNKTLKELI